MQAWLPQFLLTCALVQEYAKILKLFKKNAACVRRLNAEYNPGGDPDEVRVLCL